jgi:GGDEF domain-containing protein
VVALPGYTRTSVYEIGDALRRTVNSAAPVIDGISFVAGTLSVSIGLACLAGDDIVTPGGVTSHDGEVGEALFRAADRALYVAKNSGRNRIIRADVVHNTRESQLPAGRDQSS